MKYYSLTSDISGKNYIVTTTNYKINPTKYKHTQKLTPQFKKPRKQTQLGTDDYNRSLRRAFARAKALAFFNPDLTQFLTFTYSGTTHTPEQVHQHIKDLVKKHNKKKPHDTHLPTPPSPPPDGSPALKSPTRGMKPSDQDSIGNRNQKNQPTPNHPITQQDSSLHSRSTHSRSLSSRGKSEQVWKPFKYIYVMEYQKRGSIHVHMVCNDALEYQRNKYGYLEVKDWSQGFTNVQTIMQLEEFDQNFRPYLYLFKYMNKAERIGKSFIHVSRNFDKLLKVDYARYINRLKEENQLYKEDFEFIINDQKYRITKEYYRETQARLSQKETSSR